MQIKAFSMLSLGSFEGLLYVLEMKNNGFSRSVFPKILADWCIFFFLYLKLYLLSYLQCGRWNITFFIIYTGIFHPTFKLNLYLSPDICALNTLLISSL